MGLTKIDRLLVTNFLPPFVVTFFVAMFVFVMQTLWLYIDDIAGKGVGFFLMVELVGYMSVSMIPLSLPVAVLISSVMVLGNLAERYELSSIKSAGVSLWRVMRPLMAVTVCIAVLSFFCSNFFIPVSNLKFKSRLHDIRNQKPALSLEESLFNEDFQGFSIRIADKHSDNRTLENVLLYDNHDAGEGRLAAVAADSGVMSVSADQKYFVMHLFDGSQVVEPKPVIKQGKRNYPMVRTHFKEWTKVFDLNEFEIDRTDENLFKSHHTMLSNRQLKIAIDSIDVEIKEKMQRVADDTDKHFFFWNQALKERAKEERKKERLENPGKQEQPADAPSFSKPLNPNLPIKKPGEYAPQGAPAEKLPQVIANQIDKLAQSSSASSGESGKPPKPKLPGAPKSFNAGQPANTAQPADSAPPTKPATVRQTPQEPFAQTITKDLKSYESIVQTFPRQHWGDLFDKAKSVSRTLYDQAENAQKSMKRTRESRVKHVFEFYSKFSLAVACIIFLFVGAPMGAIVRKGGFGWPLLISIVFFMLFIVVGIFSKNIAERFVIEAVPAAWMNCMVVFPMGLVLTFWAMRDMTPAQVVDFLGNFRREKAAGLDAVIRHLFKK